MGKAYTHRKKIRDRPKSDFYQTSRPLVWELMKLDLFDFNKSWIEPFCGEGAITLILNDYFKSEKSYANDLKYGYNFMNEDRKFDYVISNPPFSDFDNCVMKAKEIAKEKIAFIGKTNFFGAEKRNRIGVWKHLKHVYVFNRQVDYRYFREDNKMICGNLISAWFIWDMNWNENYWMTSIIDVQKYILKNQKSKKIITIKKNNLNDSNLFF